MEKIKKFIKINYLIFTAVPCDNYCDYIVYPVFPK